MRPVLFAAALGLATLATADQAVVIGVDKYQNPTPPALKGPGNDATDMAAFCKRQGYKTQVLIGAQATKAAILAALEDLTKNVKPGEKALFYFAGHGSNRGTSEKPRCCILPYDYSDMVADSSISVDELYALMKRIPTKANRTVILDSCYSGGMSRDVDGFRSRGYSPRKSRGGDLDFGDEGAPPPQAGPPAGAAKDICYLTAASATEKALEFDYDGQAHGIFTKALIPELSKDQTCEETASNVRTSIAKLFRDHNSSRKQTPEVTDAFKPLLALKQAPGVVGGPPPPPPVPPKAVWDLLTHDRPDVQKLILNVETKRSGVLLGEPVRIVAKVGAPGYLVVVWSGKSLELLRPQRSLNGSIAPVRVEPGPQELSFPSGSAFTQPGENRITALLFDSPGPAQSLIDSLAGAKPPTLEDLQNKGVVEAGNGSKAYATSALTFEVGEELVGGYQIADAPGLFAALSKGATLDDLDNYADPTILRALRAEGAAVGNPKAFSAALTTTLNLVLYVLATKKEALVGPDEPGLTPAQAALAKETAKALATATPQEGAVLNAKLLATLMPTQIKAVGK